MFRNNKEGLRFITLLMAIVMIAMVILPAVPVEAVGESNTSQYTLKAEELIQNIFNEYMKDGKVSSFSNTELDGFAIYVLNKANVDVLSWKHEGKTVEEKLDSLIADAKTKEKSTSSAINARYLANLYIAAISSGKTDDAEILLEYLKIRQKNTLNGGFLDGDFSEYTNIPVFDILSITEKLDILDKSTEAFEYVRGLDPTISEYPDFMTISQTGRILKGFEVQLGKIDLDNKIKTILDWQKDNQDVDGSFNAGGGNVATNTSEVLWTIGSVGITDTLTVDDRNNALEFLVEKKAGANIGANIWSLRSLLLNGAKPGLDPVGGSSDTEPLNTVTIRIEGPDYTVLPKTEVEVVGGKSYSDILIENAIKLGYTVQQPDGYIGSVNNILGQSYWAVAPYQDIYSDGDSFVFYGGGSGNFGEITLTKNSAEPREIFTATVKDSKDTPVEGATVIYYTENKMTSPTKIETLTDTKGEVKIKIDTEGIYYLAAHKINTGTYPTDNGLVRTLPKTITVQKYQPPAPVVERIKVYIAVLDDDGKIIYGPDSVRLNKDDKFGFTALGALDETGLRYDAGKNNDFVTDIERIKNKGLSGWMFAVNGRAPGVGVRNYEIKDGDEVLWYYSKSESSRVPSFPDEKDKEKQDKEEEKEKEKDKVVTPPNYVIPPKRTFPDVGANIPWAKEAIEVLAGRGIISGTGTGQFEPNRSINRAEFAKLVVETLGNKSLSQGSGMFSDVDSAKWYADYIGKAFATGLIEGSNGKFRPLENITRNEVAVMLHRMQNKVVPNNGIISFKDEKEIPNWARLSVAYAIERGLIKGYDDNTFKGNQPMTRAEVAVVLYRYIQMMNL